MIIYNAHKNIKNKKQNSPYKTVHVGNAEAGEKEMYIFTRALCVISTMCHQRTRRPHTVRTGEKVSIALISEVYF